MDIVQVKAIMESDEVQKSRSGNPALHRFVIGYDLLSRCMKWKTPEQIEPTGHGVIYTFRLDDLPDLDEMTVREVGRQGFYYDPYAQRFCYNVREFHGERTA